MALNIENIAAELKEVIIPELDDPAEATEEESGMSTAAPVTVAAAGDAVAVEEQTGSIVKLTVAGGQKVEVIKTVCETTGLGLKETRVVVGGAPALVKEGVSKKKAEELEAKLEEVSVSVTVK